MNKKKAVVLLSGGLDSTTVMALADSEGYDVNPLSVSYKQRHSKELLYAELVSQHYKKQLRVVRIDSLDFGASALTSDIDVPFDRDESKMADGIPVTYVPARNSIFVSIAYSYAESIGAEAVFVGFNAVDYSGYPDCRPEFVKAFSHALSVGTRDGGKIQLRAPIIEKTKVEIVDLALRLNAPLWHTWSCYSGGTTPCGRCDSCVIRAAAFSKLQVKDPAQ